MYHDASEVLTGDLPTPVKYFNSQIAREYKAIEKIAQQKLVDMVPDELRDIFEPLIDEHHYSEEEQSIVKQADALCAYLKCLEELSAGNNEFLLAKGRLEKDPASRRSAEMDYFMQVFVPSFQLSLDEISQIRRCKVLAGRRLCSTRPEYLKTETVPGLAGRRPPSPVW